MQAPNKVRILDCTLRDGGYYNDWDFSPKTVSSYLHAMAAANVDAVEIGFRFFPKDRFFGPFAYSTDDVLASLPFPRNSKMAVMANAKELLNYSKGPAAAVDYLFAPAENSPVDIVRIAAHFDEAKDCAGIVERLKQLGYSVAFNLMQANGKTSADLTEIGRTIKAWNTVDTLYLADSLGSMRPDEVRESMRALHAGWKGETGLHTHDNMGWALANCLAGVDAGVTWLDGTIQGMGRGAGNVRTEYLLIELKNLGIGNYYPDGVFPVVLEDFEALRTRYGWGPSLLYYLSASYGIHPTYIQELLSKNQYQTHDIIGAMDVLRHVGASAYKEDQLVNAVVGKSNPGTGTWSPAQLGTGKTILVVGPGPGARQHADGLVRFIEKTQPTVIALNASDVIPSDKVTAYAACHHTSLLLDVDKYKFLKKPLILPLAAIPEEIRQNLSDVKVLDYGMQIKKDCFSVATTHCAIPVSLVAAYVLAIGVASGAKRILLAGFDGYESSDPRHLQMEEVFERYFAQPQAVPLLAITPTTYSVPKGSLYSPGL